MTAEIKSKRLQKRISRVSKQIGERFPSVQFVIEPFEQSARITGDAPNAEIRHAIGNAAAKALSLQGLCRGILNDMTVEGKAEKPMKVPAIRDNLLEGRYFDAVVIGGGVTGCAIARELTRWNISVAVLEKESDLAMQASGRNDGMIHPGFADNPKKRKGHINSRANGMYDQAAKELGFDIKWTGTTMLFNSPLLRLTLPYMRWRCKKNGVRGNCRYVSKKEMSKLEPHIEPVHHGGFFIPSAGVASPFKVTIAYAENAAQNGAEFFLETAVLGMQMEQTGFNSETGTDKSPYISHLITNRGILGAGAVINAAGVWADKIADFAGDRFFSIHPRKGTDIILDKKTEPFQKTCIGMPDLFAVSKAHSKGGGLVPCAEGNVLVGPTAEEVYDREDFSTSEADFDAMKHHFALNKKLSRADIIAYYAGIRPATWEEDFIIEASQKVQNLIHAAGIQSPGFASAPAIARDISALTVQRLNEARTGRGKKPIEPNPFFNPVRKTPPDLAKMSADEKHALIQSDSAYGKIVCRCEQVSEGEIRDAVRRSIPALTVDAVKRRVRSGAGRCHGGFCMPRVMEIISRETGIPPEKLTKKGGASRILLRRLEDAEGDAQ